MEVHKTEVKGIVLNLQLFQLHDLIRSILADLQPVLEKNRVILTDRVNEDLPPVLADRTQIWRVLNNAIDNAIKHNPHGIELTLDAKKVCFFILHFLIFTFYFLIKIGFAHPTVICSLFSIPYSLVQTNPDRNAATATQTRSCTASLFMILLPSATVN
ncbi:MAG: sensor histidine kinase [Xenococcaceae cyanobacterium]